MEQLNLNWQTYNEHLKEMMQHLMQSHESYDVTLVCEDKTKFKAHQFVLNACSPIFQSIINDVPQKDPIIYLRGVLAPEMKSILQFMYLGQATFFQDRMQEFLNVAHSLEIKEIRKEINCVVSDTSQNLSCDEPNIGNVHEEDFILKDFILNSSNDLDVVEHNIISQMNAAGQYPCNRCDKQFSLRKNLYRHMRSTHEGVKFSCNDCDYKATRKQNLVIHIRSVHEGKCKWRDFKAANPHGQGKK